MPWKGEGRVDKGVKRASVPRERRGVRLRMQANGSGDLTISRYLLESIGLIGALDDPAVAAETLNLSHVKMELSVATDPESGCAYVRVEPFERAERRAPSDLATRWNEEDAWKLRVYGKIDPAARAAAAATAAPPTGKRASRPARKPARKR